MLEQPMKVWEQAYKNEKNGKKYARAADEGAGVGTGGEWDKKKRPGVPLCEIGFICCSAVVGNDRIESRGSFRTEI